jgi:hypothetical protein
MLKESVSASSVTVKFWLAWSLEVLYGCDNFPKKSSTPSTPTTGTIPPAEDQRHAPQPGCRVFPDLARAVGGATIGLFLSQLLFLSDKGANPDGWVYKSEAEMGKETGLSKREQQTARRKLLALGVIAIMWGGWKNTYHFKVIWEKLYQVIAGSQRTQNVPTERNESVQSVATQPPECVQNVSTKWKQNAATHNRENNTENKVIEKTDQRENQKTWDKAVEQVKNDLPLGETAARLAGTTLIEVTETVARIGVANPFALALLERRLYSQIAKAMKRVVGKDLDLQFVSCP